MPLLLILTLVLILMHMCWLPVGPAASCRLPAAGGLRNGGVPGRPATRPSFVFVF